eukprot:gene12479-12267_t
MRVLFVALGLLLIAAPSAQALPEARWAAFVEDSYSPYGEGNDPPNWEDLLHRAAKANKSRDAALRQFAADIKVPLETAEGYAETIITAVESAEKDCARPADGCALAPGAPLRALVERYAAAEPSGELLFAVAQAMESRPVSQTVVFIGLIKDHPGRGTVLSRLYDYAESPIVLAAMIQDAPASDFAAAGLGRTLNSSGTNEVAPGGLEAILEVGH